MYQVVSHNENSRQGRPGPRDDDGAAKDLAVQAGKPLNLSRYSGRIVQYKSKSSEEYK